ncbi:MAG: hypothetical protein EOP34_09070 [Rickettsiales bacterium]|nr:MAG: hypothetical protein EOP34_09070 [Rickettsiales bacterium]
MHSKLYNSFLFKNSNNEVVKTTNQIKNPPWDIASTRNTQMHKCTPEFLVFNELSKIIFSYETRYRDFIYYVESVKAEYRYQKCLVEYNELKLKLATVQQAKQADLCKQTHHDKFDCGKQRDDTLLIARNETDQLKIKHTQEIEILQSQHIKQVEELKLKQANELNKINKKNKKKKVEINILKTRCKELEENNYKLSDKLNCSEKKLNNYRSQNFCNSNKISQSIISWIDTERLFWSRNDRKNVDNIILGIMRTINDSNKCSNIDEIANDLVQDTIITKLKMLCADFVKKYKDELNAHNITKEKLNKLENN